MTFYTDSTTPKAMSTIVNGFTYNAAIAGKIEYALYEDSATWSAWTTWAKNNGLNANNVSYFSSRALEVKGTWDSFVKLPASDNLWVPSFMCMEDKGTANNRGAWCAVANVVTASSTTTYASKTFRMSSADFQTKVANYTPARTLGDLIFTATTNTSPAVTETAEVVGSYTNYKAF